MTSHLLKPCPGCGALVPQNNGPTHPYIGAAAGCWAIYGEVLATEYADPNYLGAHKLTVDAYAVQHPGVPSRQSIQSVAVHLISLCYILELGADGEQSAHAIRQALLHNTQFIWLTPPTAWGGMTILNVATTKTYDAHTASVRRWAESVWAAWAPHHATVRRWATLCR